MTKKILQLIAVALAGYVVYELFTRWSTGRGVYGEPAPAPGRPGGATFIGGGTGSVQRSTGFDGSSVTERVGRGVVRRGQRSA